MKPLLRLKGFNVDGLLFLYGDTGTLKTSFASLIVSDPNSMLKVLDVNRKELHQKAKQYKDGIVFLDDMKLLANKYKNGTVVDFLDVVARCEDLATYPSILVTSEVLAGSESLQDRMIQVHANVRVKNHSEKLLKRLFRLTNEKDALNTLWYLITLHLYKNKNSTLSIIANNYDLMHGDNSGYRISKNVGALKLVYVLLKEYLGYFLNKDEERLVYSNLDCLKKKQMKKINVQRAKEFKCNWAEELFKIIESKAFHDVSQEDQIDLQKGMMYIPSRCFEKIILLYYYPERLNINEICRELFALGVLHVTESKGYTCKYNGKHHYVINTLRLELLCGNRKPTIKK